MRLGEEGYLRTLARYSHDIRTGGLNFDYRTGQCGPVQATQLRSWGAACPPGFCPPDRLPEQLGRWFAGDRTGCRELPMTIRLDGTAGVAAVTVTRELTSRVTMCPTRVMAWHNADGEDWLINEIQFGNQNQLVGGPVPAAAFDPQAFQDVPIVPDCIYAGQPISITATLGIGEDASSLWIVFIGPTIG